MNPDGNTQIIATFVVSAFFLLIGAYMLGVFIDTMPSLEASNPFAALMTNISDVTSSAYGILVILLIVIAGGGLIWYLRRIM